MEENNNRMITIEEEEYKRLTRIETTLQTLIALSKVDSYFAWGKAIKAVFPEIMEGAEDDD